MTLDSGDSALREASGEPRDDIKVCDGVHRASFPDCVEGELCLRMAERGLVWVSDLERILKYARMMVRPALEFGPNEPS